MRIQAIGNYQKSQTSPIGPNTNPSSHVEKTNLKTNCDKVSFQRGNFSEIIKMESTVLSPKNEALMELINKIIDKKAQGIANLRSKTRSYNSTISNTVLPATTWNGSKIELSRLTEVEDRNCKLTVTTKKKKISIDLFMDGGMTVQKYPIDKNGRCIKWTPAYIQQYKTEASVKKINTELQGYLNAVIKKTAEKKQTQNVFASVYARLFC